MWKNVVIVILVIIVLSFILSLRGTKTNNSNYTNLSRKIDSLTLLNKALSDSAVASQNKAKALELQVDSLSCIESQIKPIYKIKYEKINTLTAYPLANEFKPFLTDSNLFVR